MRAAIFCRPVGPGIVMFRIQGQRAARSPLATFSTRLRRSDPGLRSRRASGAQIRAYVLDAPSALRSEATFL
jgi:hypothetical protein